MEKIIIISAMLFNNPAAHLLLNLPYKTMDWQSNPMIFIEAKNLPAGSFEMEVEVRNNHDKPIYSFKNSFESKDGTYSDHKILDVSLKAPACFFVKLKSGEKETVKKIPIELARLHGTVTDFDGKPIHGAWITILDDHMQIAISDNNGGYELFLPKGNYNCLAAVNNEYPFGKLENYIWNLPLNQDYQYDFKLGSAEVFRLMASAMPQNRTISGTFVGWTSSLFRNWAATKTGPRYEMGDEFLLDKYVPALNRDNTSFYLDGIKIEKVPLFEKADILFPKNKIAENYGYRFEFFIPENIPVKQYHVLEVEIQSPVQLKGKTIMEKGKATLHNLEIY